MARIAGVDIPREKRLEISLTYIFGIGRTTSQKVCEATGIDENTRVRDLTDEEVARLRTWIDTNLKVEGDLRRDIQQDIKRKMEIRSEERRVGNGGRGQGVAEHRKKNHMSRRK